MKKSYLFIIICTIALLIFLGKIVLSSDEVKPSNVQASGATSSSSPSNTTSPSAEPSSSQPMETASPTTSPSSSPEPSESNSPAEPSSEPSNSNETPAFSSNLIDNLPSKTVSSNSDGLAVVTNSTSTLVVVNKQRNLPSDYVPSDLVIPDVEFSFSGDNPKKQMRKEAAKALESLFAAAKEDKIELKAVSGYRSYATQKSLFANYVNKDGEKAAARYSARPGQSEHQTGLAMDVSSASVSYDLDQSYGETKEGKWLSEHAAEHGFIIRYMKDKEDITGYMYEPWHVRYVGIDTAKEIMKQGVTLEEYFEGVAASTKS
ncbi:MAG: M15 family metallopeptidase [Candidatus Cohnella colombiensis]|uniref:M15 family metallopeptidase n=1 Tax=Candidatus Cohnella colombiensis TaxID=3121368 RepID=A0AA95JBY5_9BACL|nr:MAG: M15 family metallopeptidase [Cohnella sp.]